MVRVDKEVLFNLIDSLDELMCEAGGDEGLPPDHYSVQARIKMLENLRESGWLDEYLSWRGLI